MFRLLDITFKEKYVECTRSSIASKQFPTTQVFDRTHQNTKIYSICLFTRKEGMVNEKNSMFDLYAKDLLFCRGLDLMLPVV